MNSIIRKLVWWLMPAALGGSAAALAQDKAGGYPVRPVRIIIAGAPRAGGDLLVRGAGRRRGSARSGQGGRVPGSTDPYHHRRGSRRRRRLHGTRGRATTERQV